jgi:hypothetical protein
MPTQQEDNKKNTFNRLKDKQFWTNVGFSVTLIVVPQVIYGLVYKKDGNPYVNLIFGATTEVLKGAAVGNMVRHGGWYVMNED